MDRELVAILVADLVVLTLVLATAVPAMVAEARHLGRAMVRLLRQPAVIRARRAAIKERALQDRMLALVEMPAPLPVLTSERAQLMQVQPLSQETLQAMREPQLRLVPLPEVLPPPLTLTQSLRA
jgi:hypothetical protein